jgi:MoaA/NifB/PqqE/SkfB family radical SAM enzyme
MINEYDVPDALVQKMKAEREQLRKEKPRIYEKLMNYLKLEKDPKNRGMSLIDFAYSFECNFSCEHCCASIFQRQITTYKMNLDQVRSIADQADELGVFVFSLIGGEPLIWKDLDDLIRVIDPSRFFISITTNGWLFTKKRAHHLKTLGVRKVNVSIDSIYPEEHDRFREKKGSFVKAVEAVKNGMSAGLNTQISTVVTHQNLHSHGFKGLLDFAVEKGTCLDIQVATPSGKWLGNTESLIDADDAEYIQALRKKYPLLRRDVFSTPGAIGGCPATTGSLYIIANGDVLPCLFIHISLGNILKEPLRTIRERGLRIKELKEYSPVCLAGEQCTFFDKYMTHTFSAKTFPLSFNEGFYDIPLSDPNIII